MTTNNNNNNNFDDDDYDDDVKLPPAAAAAAAAAAVVKKNNDNNSNDTDNNNDNVDYLSPSLSLCLLPNEIMKRITMYLPSNDAINFSLSSKHIKSCLVLAVLPSRKFNVNSRVFVGGQRRRDGGGGGGGPPRRGRGDNNHHHHHPDVVSDDVVNNKQPKEAFRIPLLYNQSSNTVQAHSVTLSINWCMLPPFLDDQGINHNNAIRRDPNNANNNNNNQPVTRKIWLIGRQKDMERRTMMTSMTDDQLYNHNINIHQHQEGRHENNIMNDDDDDDDILLQKPPPPPSSLPPFDGGRIVYEFTSTISLRQSDRGAPEHLRIPFTPEENEVYEIWCGCGGCGTIDDPSGDQQQQQQIQPTPHNTFYFRDLKIDTLIFDFDTDYTFSHNYKSMLNAEIAFTQRRFLSEYGVHYNNNSNNNNGRPRPRQGPGFGGSNMIARNDMLPSKTSFMGDLLLSTCQSLRQRLEATTTSSSSSSSNEQPPPAIDPIMSSFLDQYGILKSVASFRCIEDMIQTERNDREYSEMRHQQRQQQGNNNNRNNGANGNGDGVAGGGGGAFVGGNITITVNGRVIGEDQQLHQFNIGEGQPLNFGGVGGNNNNGPGQPQVFVHRVGGGGGGGGAARGAGGAGLAGLGGGLGAFLNGIINGGAGGGGGEQQQQQEEQQAQQQQQNDRVEQAAAVAAAAANDDDDDEIGVVVDVDMEEEEREDRQQEANEQRQNNGPNGIAAVHDAAAAAHQAAAAAQEAAAAAQAAANAAQEAARGQHQEQGIPREAGAGAGGGAGNNPDMNDILGGIPPEVQNMLPPGLLENIIMGDGTGVGGGIAVGGGFRPPPHQQAAAGAGAQNDDDDDDDEEEGPQAEVHVVEVPIHIPDGGGNPNININLPGGAFDGGAQPQVFFGGAQMFGGGPGGGDIPPEAEGMIFQQIAQMMAGNGGNMAMGGMGMGAFPFPPPPPPQNDDDDSIPEID